MMVPSYSQQPEEAYNTSEWFVTSYFGNATLEVENTFKTIAQVAGGALGRQLPLGDNLSLIAALELQRVRADLDLEGSNTFLANNYAKLPILVELSATVTSATKLYVQAGPYASYLFLATLEQVAENVDVDDTNLGFSFGIQASAGLAHQFTDFLSLRLGLLAQTDLFESYNNDSPQFKLRDVYAFQLGAGIKI
jgi:hypothetical protein